MRLVHPTRVRVIEVTATLRGLVELELDPRDIDAYADAGKTRRLLREELLTDKRSPEDFLAVRVDQLLEQGWEEPKGDPGMLRALANVEPWRSWLAAAADKQRLADLWRSWAPEPHLTRIIGAVTRIVPRLTGLHVGFGAKTLECTLPLGAAALDRALPTMRELLACHARILGYLEFPLREPYVRQAWKTGWLGAESNVRDGAFVAEAIDITYASTARAGW